MTSYKKEYRKRFNFDDFAVTVHNVYDDHKRFIGYGGCITRTFCANSMLIWVGNAWTGRKSNLKNGAYLLLQEYREVNRKIKGV